jgi:Uma2 family endonuclease
MAAGDTMQSGALSVGEASTQMSVTEQEYIRLALAEPDTKWELFCGELRVRPPMTWEHVRSAAFLHDELRRQLPRDQYVILSEAGRLRRDERHSFIPDVMVVPVTLARELFREPGTLASFPVPLPVVAEVWSPSTGGYDVAEKPPEYQRRGDLEIWFLHPYERTITAWVRRSNGGYDETLHRAGIVRLSALPGVAIDLDALFVA